MTYEVSVTATIDKTIVVEAEDDEEARDIAEAKVCAELHNIPDVTEINAWDVYRVRKEKKNARS